MDVTQSSITQGDVLRDTDSDAGPIERQARADVAALGPLAGVNASIAEICYALARSLDSGEVPAPAPVARELANRLAELERAAGGRKVSRVDELAARRKAHVAATQTSPGAETDADLGS